MALRWRARQGKRCRLQLGQRCAWRRDMIDDRAAIVPESEGVSVCGTGMHGCAASSRLTRRNAFMQGTVWARHLRAAFM